MSFEEFEERVWDIAAEGSFKSSDARRIVEAHQAEVVAILEGLKANFPTTTYHSPRADGPTVELSVSISTVLSVIDEAIRKAKGQE